MAMKPGSRSGPGCRTRTHPWRAPWTRGLGTITKGRPRFLCWRRVDDFDAAYQRMISAGVQFLTPPRSEPYGRVAVFRDIADNRWDLLGPG
jgi:predicted enzyme related to lactoylglutathione lyase